MSPFPGARPASGVLAWATLLSAAVSSGPVWAEGILEGLTGDMEARYGLLSTRTRDASGATTKTETGTYEARFNLRLNYDLLPKLNLNAGLSYEKDVSEQSGDAAGANTEVTRLRPSLWLTRRDPVLSAAIGYDLQDETVKTSGLQALTLTRETAAANLNWRPADLPSLQVRYTRTATRDDPRTSLDTQEDNVFLKSEYLYGGLKASYTGTYLRTNDAIRDSVSSQLSHEGNLLYAATLLDGRVSVVTDNRVTLTELGNVPQVPVISVTGLSALDDTPLDGPLDATPALVDGDLTTSAGPNLGFPGPGGDFRPRNVGLDFRAAVEVSRLHVWVNGWGADNLPSDIATSLSWDVYTSTDNLTWTFLAKVPAVFGPFDRRFELDFPAVTTRFIKAVTRPLSGGVIGATNSALFPNISVTEVQAFVTRAAQEVRGTVTQLVQNYNLEVKVVLWRVPFVYYRFNGYYYKFDSSVGGDAADRVRYNISNGLFLDHRFNPVFSASANASVEVGTEEDEARRAVLYYASLTATPLRTVTSSLAVSGNAEWVGESTRTRNSAFLYNAAQLYKGIDASLNLGASFTTDEERAGASGATAPRPGPVTPPPPPRLPFGSQFEERIVAPAVSRLGQAADSRDVSVTRRELYVNPGIAITPHPSLTMTAYYLGKLTHSSGSGEGGARDTTENQLDLGLSFTPFRTLALTAAVNVTSETGQGTTVRQSYGLSWAPFPDGRLQFSFFYGENRLPDQSRIIQPTVRWYLSSARRSYLEAGYQFNTTESEALKTQSHLFTTGLRIFY